jgi:hypothetical protein
MVVLTLRQVAAWDKKIVHSAPHAGENPYFSGCIASAKKNLF